MHIARWLLRRCGCAAPEQVLADLDEEAARQRRRGSLAPAVRLWWLGQLLLVCLYEARDRLAGTGARDRPRPLLALRLALRGLAHRPAVAVTAAATLALGFGAAAAIYSVYVGGFAAALPVPDGDRVVQVRLATPEGSRAAVDPGLLRAWSRSTTSLEALGGFRTRSAVLSGDGIAAVRLSAAEVTPEALRLLRVPPALGSLPGPGDDGVVLGHDPWLDSLGADPGVVGRAVRVDGRVRTVAAVMPAGFGFPFDQRLWLPLGATPGGPLEPVGRLAGGVDADRAAEELQARYRAWQETADGADPEARVRVAGFTDGRGEGGEKVALGALLILVVALVLVSCSNVANLLLARALARSRTLAVQAAIGAPPGQVVVQLLAEALLIALGGAALGLGLAGWAVRYIETTLSGHWGYWWMEVSLRPAVLLFTLALALATALLSGGLPALRLRRADLTETLKSESGSVGADGRLSRALLLGQVALSCAALVVAALMARGLLDSRRVTAGFPAESVRVASLTLEGDGAGGRRALRRDLLAGLAEADEVALAALSSGLPGTFASWGRLEVEGRPAAEGAPPPAVASLAVSPGFFDVYGIRPLRGRLPGEADGLGGEAVAVVSEDFVERHLPGEDPIGRGIRVRGVSEDAGWARIVGVVSDVVLYDGPEDTRADWVYLPVERIDPETVYLSYRPSGDPTAARAAVRAALRELDPELPLGGVFGGEPLAPFAEVLDYVRRLFVTIGVLAGLGGLAASLVAMSGLYGAVAFDVQRRVPEIGLRMALGADRGRVLRAIVGAGLRRLLPGLVLGLGAAWLAGPLFGIFLMGAEARDPVVFGLVASGYVLVALAASLPPARRAAGLDPARVLASE